jgi:hypothetical protein
MKLIQSNHRHKYYYEGMTHIIEFKIKNSVERKLYVSMCRDLTEMYGPAKIETGVQYWDWKWNENYRTESNMYAKRLRIYLKDGANATLLMLKLGHTNG